VAFWSFRNVLLALGFFVFGAADHMRGFLLPFFVADFQLQSQDVSLFFALSTLCSVLASSSAPLFQRWFPIHRVIGYGFWVFLFALSLLMAVQTRFQLFLASALLGFGFGILEVYLSAAAVIEDRTRSRSRNQSIFYSMGLVSAILLPILIVVSSNSGWGWKASLIPIWAICFFLALGFQFKQFWIRKVSHVEVKKVVHWFSVFRKHLLLILAGVGWMSFEIFLGSRLGLLLRNPDHSTLNSTTIQFGIFFVILFISRMGIGAWLQDKSAHRNFILFILASTFTVFLGMLASPLWFFASAFFIGPVFPLWMVLVGSLGKYNTVRMIALATTATSLLLAAVNLLLFGKGDWAGSEIFVGLILFLIAPLAYAAFGKNQESYSDWRKAA
jgi:MFS family permease